MLVVGYHLSYTGKDYWLQSSLGAYVAVHTFDWFTSGPAGLVCLLNPAGIPYRWFGISLPNLVRLDTTMSTFENINVVEKIDEIDMRLLLSVRFSL